MLMTHKPSLIEHMRLWCLSRRLSLSVGFSIQEEAMNVTRSAPQEARYQADVIDLRPWLKIKKGARLTYANSASDQ